MPATLYVTSRQQWRQWLEQHHDSQKEIWLIYYKKYTGKPSIPYDEAVEEAICYGWIDSIVKRIDEERYQQKFTPRTNWKNWSDLNLKRVKKLVKEKRMTGRGLSRIPGDLLKGKPKSSPKARKRDFPMPEELARLLAENQEARGNFEKLSPSHRKNYQGWIGSGKKPETRERRAREAIQLLEKGKPLGLK